MTQKGIVKTKSSFSHKRNLVGDESLYLDSELIVLDVSVSDDGYLVLNKDRSAMGDISKEDTLWFKKIDEKRSLDFFFDMMKQGMKV